MTGRNDNELKHLAEGFFDGQQFQDCLDDFERCEALLTENPAPHPSVELLARIKGDVAVTIVRRRRTRNVRRIFVAAAPVAAAAVFAIAIRVGLFETGTLVGPDTVTATIIPAALWDSDDVSAVDPSLVYFAAEIEQIESELAILQSGKEQPVGDMAVTELEMEFIEIEGEFWKG